MEGRLLFLLCRSGRTSVAQGLSSSLLPLALPSPPLFLSSFSRDHLVQNPYIKDGGTEVQKGAHLAQVTQPGRRRARARSLTTDHRLPRPPPQPPVSGPRTWMQMHPLPWPLRPLPWSCPCLIFGGLRASVSGRQLPGGTKK